jgi:hypothetical protein
MGSVIYGSFYAGTNSGNSERVVDGTCWQGEPGQVVNAFENQKRREE